MQIGYLKPVYHDVGPHNKKVVRRVWRIVDANGIDLVDVWPRAKANALRLAEEAGIVLMPDGVTAEALKVMHRLAEHFGTTWKSKMRRAWAGEEILPPHLWDCWPVVQSLKSVRPLYLWEHFKLPEIPDEKTPT